jgi:polyisoprenoid-binding protein YceI
VSRHSTSRAWVAAALTAALPCLATATLKVRGQPDVHFAAAGPAGLRIDGEGKELQISERPDALMLSIPLTTITTGISLRDRHMREKYLEVSKFPTAQLAVARSALKFPVAGQEIESTVPGTMALHGKTKTVSVHYRASRNGNALKVSGDVRLDMRDYGIETPSYLGATVKPMVDVTVAFVLDDL